MESYHSSLVSRHDSRNSGFTLMEILIAIFIFGIVMATVLGTFTGIISSSQSAEKRAELYQTGRSVMDLISTDIRGIFGQKGEGEHYFFVGTTESIEGEPMSGMDFVTTNSLAVGPKINPFLAEVGYHVRKNSNEGLYSLWRRAQSPPEPPYREGGREVPVCRIIESFMLEFAHNNDRKKSLTNFIPAAIMIRFTLNLDGERESFLTMVRPMITVGG